ncbi:MAG: alpha/beta fold hydrolase [Acidobacteriaceae bacterium]
MTGGSLFLTVQPKPEAAVRLFCFPHGGGGPVSFFPWNGLLGPEIECVGVQYPGRGQRWSEPACLSLAELVEEIFSRWGELSEKAFAFYGHSFGGLVAFELARRLRRAGMASPQWLFVGASRAPQLDLLHAPIHELPDDAFLDAMQTRYGGIPAAIRAEREMMDLLLVPMRADLTAYERYRMEEDAPLTMPVTAFAGAEDFSVPASCMEGWSLQTEAAFELMVLPGGHFFPQSNLKSVTDGIRKRLLQQNRGGNTPGVQECCTCTEEGARQG